MVAISPTDARNDEPEYSTCTFTGELSGTQGTEFVTIRFVTVDEKQNELDEFEAAEARAENKDRWAAVYPKDKIPTPPKWRLMHHRPREDE